MNVFRKLAAFFLDAFETIVLSLVIFVLVYFFVAAPHQVKGLSMYPTFDDRELILTDKISYRMGDPKLDDVVVFKAPTNPEYDYIKRIIGVPGDRIRIEDAGVYLNGKKLNEQFLPSDTITSGGMFLPLGREVTIPADEYFVMGDNRSGSADSRAWGFVKRRELIGKVFFRYFPFNKLGLVPSPQ